MKCSRFIAGLSSALLILPLAGCSFFLGDASSAPTSSAAPTTSNLKLDDNIRFCGVSGTARSGHPSNVLLTIDDYPHNADGKRMVDIADWARSAGVMMLAFPIMKEVKAYQAAHGVDLLTELRVRGTYVGNHSYSHRDFGVLKPDEIITEIREGAKSTFLRPPYGDLSKKRASDITIRQLIEQQGYRICTWNIDTEDWKRKPDGTFPSTAELVQRVHTQLMALPDGEPVVILGHYYTNYPNALAAIVDEVKKMGNHFCATPTSPVSDVIPVPIC